MRASHFILQIPYKAAFMAPNPRPAQAFWLRWLSSYETNSEVFSSRIVCSWDCGIIVCTGVIYDRTIAKHSITRSPTSIRLSIRHYGYRYDQRNRLLAAHSTIPLIFERAKRCHRKWGLDWCISTTSKPTQHHSGDPYLHKILLGFVLPRYFLGWTF